MPLLSSARPIAPLAVALAALLALLGSGCTQRDTAVESGNRDQVIHIGNLTEPTDLDPHVIKKQFW